MINLPSLANCNFLDMDQQIEQLVFGGVKMVHIDIMDGHYVPNLCFPLKLIRNIKERYPGLKTDVHLMVDDPQNYILPLKENGADYVSFHIDSTPFVIRTLISIKNAGMKCGVVINPSQHVNLITPYCELLDYAVLMTVEPGFAGQLFLENQLDRVRELAAIRDKAEKDFLISIDGGISYANAEECLARGADMLVTGIYVVFNQPDGIANACRRFEEKMGTVPHTVREI